MQALMQIELFCPLNGNPSWHEFKVETHKGGGGECVEHHQTSSICEYVEKNNAAPAAADKTVLSTVAAEAAFLEEVCRIRKF